MQNELLPLAQTRALLEDAIEHLEFLVMPEVKKGQSTISSRTRLIKKLREELKEANKKLNSIRKI